MLSFHVRRVPCWPVALAFAVLPAVRYWPAAARLYRRAPHECASCGYNLTGNESGVCPECGTPAKEAK